MSAGSARAMSISPAYFAPDCNMETGREATDRLSPVSKRDGPGSCSDGVGKLTPGYISTSMPEQIRPGGIPIAPSLLNRSTGAGSASAGSLGRSPVPPPGACRMLALMVPGRVRDVVSLAGHLTGDHNPASDDSYSGMAPLTFRLYQLRVLVPRARHESTFCKGVTCAEGVSCATTRSPKLQIMVTCCWSLWPTSGESSCRPRSPPVRVVCNNTYI